MNFSEDCVTHKCPVMMEASSVFAFSTVMCCKALGLSCLEKVSSIWELPCSVVVMVVVASCVFSFFRLDSFNLWGILGISLMYGFR